MFSVIAAHASVVQPILIYPASFMFVDMFFVISGYLITTIILQERESTGRVSLRAFYVRRFARLYPVIVVALAVMIISGLLRPDSPATPSWLYVAGSGLYFANFVAIANHADAVSAWISLWSLSIEEQFYAVWPIVLLWTIKKGHRLRVPLLLVSALTLAMWSWRSWSFHRVITTTYPDAGEHLMNLASGWHSFEYSTFQRPDGLLIGCALALLLARPASRSARLLISTARRARLPAIVIIVAIVAATRGGAAWQVYWGLGLFNICIALLLADLLTSQDSYLSRFLGLRAFVWIGRRTYFMYVIHLAVFTFAFEVLGLTTLPEIALIVLVIFALSGFSYRYYENPIRKWGYRVSGRSIARENTTP